MSKYLYSTVYEEFTGLKPPEPTDNKQRRKRGYGHPYRMRLNMQEETDIKQKKPERRNQFGQPINSVRKNREEQQPREQQFREQQPREQVRELPPQFNAARKQREERHEPRHNFNQSFNQNNPLEQSGQVLSLPTERKNAAMPKVTYKKRRHFNLEQNVTPEQATTEQDS